MSEKLRKLKDKASLAFSDGKLKDALKAYSAIVEEDATEIACRIKIGDIHRRLGQKKEAVAAYEPVARHYAEDGLLLKAIAVCKLILSVDATHTKTQDMLANLYSTRAEPTTRAPARTFTPSTPLQPLSPAKRPRPAAADDEIEIDTEEAGEAEMVIERTAADSVTPPAPAAPPLPAPSWGATSTPNFAWPVSQPSGSNTPPVPVIKGAKLEDSKVHVIVGTKVESPPPAQPPLSSWPGGHPAAASAEPNTAADFGTVDIAAASKPTDASGPGTVDISATAMAPLASWPGGAPAGPPSTGETARPPLASWPGGAIATGADEPLSRADEAQAKSRPEEATPADALEIAIGEPIEATGSPEIIHAEEQDSLESLLDVAQAANREGLDSLASLEEDGELDVAPRYGESRPIELSRTLRKTHQQGAQGTDDGLGGLSLPQIPLFSDLPREAFIEILVQMNMRELATGEHVIREGDIGDAFYVIASGRVRVVRSTADGGEVVLAYLTEGAFFGEMALLQDGARTASVIVEEESQIFEINRGVLDRVVAQYPGVARVLRNFYTQRLLSTTMATHALFRPFSADQRRDLMEKFRSRMFKAGDTLVREGAKGEGLYLLLTGALEVSKIRDNQPFVIAELGTGDVFGEMSLLMNRPTIATVAATKDSFVLRLAKKDFDSLIMTHPQILEMVAQISEERETENTAIFAGWEASPEAGAALV